MPKTIKMLKDFKVTRDGFTIETWVKDQVIENAPDGLADELIHSQTLAAIEVTGNKKADADAELAAIEEAERRAQEAAAALALKDASEKAALEAARKAGKPPAPPKA